MNACQAVEKELDKVLSKFNDINKQMSSQLQECLMKIQKIKQELAGLPPEAELSVAQSLLLSSSVQKIKNSIKPLSSDHKDLHSSVSKVGKAVDRNFISDYGAIVPDGLNTPETMTSMNHVVCEHFLRHGMLSIADQFVLESGLNMDDAQKEPFLELHAILEALKQHNLKPALHWVEANKEKLRERNSILEFKIHRLQFIDLIQQGPEKQLEVLMYAKHFQHFAHSHAEELQVLMGSLLYMRRGQGLANSPYAHLLDPIHWLEMCDIFTREACCLLGLSVESPLSVVIKAGCAALPPLLNLQQVMSQRGSGGGGQRPAGSVWSAKDELPIEIDLGAECHFHSIFACPILRQQSTDANPPVRLVCGHVISRDALNKLSTGARSRVKCPYCPVEQAPTEARLILF